MDMDARKATGARPWALGAAGAVAIIAALAGDEVQAAGEGSPEYFDLTGVVRDFRERTVEGGHPDFERRPDEGFHHYMGNIALDLQDGKPAFVGDGFLVESQWLDSYGNPICYTLFDASIGDVQGTAGVASTGGITSEESFKHWFTDVPGVNLSKALTLRFVRQPDGGYIFDDKDDPLYSDRGGFFPIDDELFGNSGGSPDHNFHFTFELHALFTYQADEEQIFRFVGDDDVFVFINGELVIDIGGVHPAVEQFVNLKRLELVDGQTYRLDFFFAERHRTQANFRIVTNLELIPAALPTVSSSYD
jgi:fibro-slime domain-containing protein